MKDLRLEKINIRAVNVPLNKPVIAHLGTFEKWPFLCLDVHTNKGLIGKSYIGPYLVDQLPVIAKCIEALSKHFLNQEIISRRETHAFPRTLSSFMSANF